MCLCASACVYVYMALSLSNISFPCVDVVSFLCARVLWLCVCVVVCVYAYVCISLCVSLFHCISVCVFVFLCLHLSEYVCLRLSGVFLYVWMLFCFCMLYRWVCMCV